MKAVIIGGGIGGLTAAIALKQPGVEAQQGRRIGSGNPVGCGMDFVSP